MVKARLVKDVYDVFLMGLDGLSDEFLMCRETQHIWEVTSPFRVVDSAREADRQTRGGEKVYAERVLTCERCSMVRSDAFKISSSRGRTILRKISASYDQPDGYSIPGIGRSTKGLMDFVHGAVFDADLDETPVKGQAREIEM